MAQTTAAASPRPAGPSTERLLGLMLEQAADHALFFMMPDGTVTDWFPGATRIFGFTAEEMVGQSALRLFNREDIEQGAAVHELQLAQSAGRAEDDRWHVRKDGSLFWGSGVTFAIRDEAGEVIALAKLIRNRTDLKTQTEALERRIEALQGRDRDQAAFVASLVHELRNPLAPLANAVEIIKRSAGAPGSGDSERLQQVFVNLIGNAIKYTPREGRIVVNVTTEAGDAVARVEDNGVGMSEEILPRVFDLFTQEDASREMSGGGLGLGLSLVREMVKLHGGTVQARSDGRGKGSLFTVRLPIHQATQA